MFIGHAKRNYLVALFVSFFFIGSCFSLNRLPVYAEELYPTYDGIESVEFNDNVPQFTEDEITTVSYESYGKLDKLGRCTVAEACVGEDLMPSTDRGSIGQIKPTGWKQNKYPGLVDSAPPYLYNRCHLIGYQLTGENANERNLITGTRYLNIEGMLPYENMVAEYIRSTGNHVMYRVTPIFIEDNLLSMGVKIEGLSVEDDGKGISFNVICYNVQPGVLIDYTDGSNQLDPNYDPNAKNTVATTTRSTPSANPSNTSSSKSTSVDSSKATTITGTEADYIGNKNTKKFHHPWCSSVNDMKEKNKLYYHGNRDDLINKGYVPCKRCNP